jgi:hypothetical protein
MTILVTGTIPKALKPGIDTFWGEYSEEDMVAAQLVAMETSDEAFVENVLISPFGLLETKNEGSSVAYDNMTQGYSSRYNQRTKALGFQVSWEARKFNKYLDVVAKGNKFLARSAKETKEIDVAQLFNRGFTAAFTFGDGKTLFATDHPTRSGTFSNKLATPADLSEAALEDLSIQIRTATDDRGLSIGLRPELVAVHPNQMFEIQRILYSDLRVDTANNDLNALKKSNMFPKGFVVNEHFTSTDAFFIKTNAPEGAKMITAVQGEFSNDGDFNTADHKYKFMTSYAIGIDDPRGYYASEGV